MNHSNNIDMRYGNQNRSDRRQPRSLLRDRPLAEPRRHQHSQVVTMNGDARAQHQRTTHSQYTQHESSPTQQTPLSPTAEGASPVLPSIDEASSKIDSRGNRTANYNAYGKKIINPYSRRTNSGNLLMRRAPSLATASDSSDESMLDSGSVHSTDSSVSDYSVDIDYENDDDNEISMSIRSTQSMPAALTSRRNSISTRRRPQYHLPANTLQSTIKPSTSYSSFDSSSSRPKVVPPPPPFAGITRNRSFSPTDQCFATMKSSRWQRLRNFLLSGVCMQLYLLLGIAFLVLRSRSQAAFAADTLLRLKESESMGLLKLHQLESHSMHVHDMMRSRILRKSSPSGSSDDFEDSFDVEDREESIDPWDDELTNQYKQLTEMSADLRKHADITKLQSTLQETAIEKMVKIYGEGAVKVVVELDFGDKPVSHKRRTNGMAKGTFISIILWPDTPHAAWTWLEQIRRSVWDGSFAKLNPTSTILRFGPTKDDPKDRGHIEFVESHSEREKSNPDMHHGAWTIGLRETIGDDDDKSHLEMFINLADNREERKHETCIGKIFDGFDALQRLLEGTVVTPDGEANTNVSVKSVSAMHMTHHELEQVYR